MLITAADMHKVTDPGADTPVRVGSSTISPFVSALGAANTSGYRERRRTFSGASLGVQVSNSRIALAQALYFPPDSTPANAIAPTSSQHTLVSSIVPSQSSSSENLTALSRGNSVTVFSSPGHVRRTSVPWITISAVDLDDEPLGNTFSDDLTATASPTVLASNPSLSRNRRSLSSTSLLSIPPLATAIYQRNSPKAHPQYPVSLNLPPPQGLVRRATGLIDVSEVPDEIGDMNEATEEDALVISHSYRPRVSPSASSNDLIKRPEVALQGDASSFVTRLAQIGIDNGERVFVLTEKVRPFF